MKILCFCLDIFLIVIWLKLMSDIASICLRLQKFTVMLLSWKINKIDRLELARQAAICEEES
ncbi:hypothetical protein Hanom_Chr01g00029751 [Helianthus anomalus]